MYNQRGRTKSRANSRSFDSIDHHDDFELSSRAVHFQTRKVSVVRMNAAGLGIVAVELGADMLDVEKHACSIGV